MSSVVSAWERMWVEWWGQAGTSECFDCKMLRIVQLRARIDGQLRQERALQVRNEKHLERVRAQIAEFVVSDVARSTRRRVRWRTYWWLIRTYQLEVPLGDYQGSRLDDHTTWLDAAGLLHDDYRPGRPLRQAEVRYIEEFFQRIGFTPSV